MERDRSVLLADRCEVRVAARCWVLRETASALLVSCGVGFSGCGHPGRDRLTGRLLLAGVGGGRWWVGVWLLFECCIVDASILLLWSSLLRAHGGCLGIRSR